MLTLDENVSDPTLSLDFGVPLTADSLNAQTMPTANVNGSTGFDWANALNVVNSMFDSGVKTYENVMTTIGVSKEKVAAQQAAAVKQVSVPTTQTPIVAGLNQTQLLWIAGALAGVLPKLPMYDQPPRARC